MSAALGETTCTRGVYAAKLASIGSIGITVKERAMSIVFLFGAGASFGNPDCSPYPPPLGSKLFAELRKESKVAAEFSSDLCQLFEKNFEQGMDRLWDEDPVKITPLQIEIASYFTKFKAGEKNFYKNIVELAKKSKKKIVFSTTNYDILIEQSINDKGCFIAYHGLPVKKNNFPLLKIHGSCNFLPDINPNMISGIGFIVPKNGAVLDAPVRPVSREDAKRFCDSSSSMAPAIAVYSEGKQVLHCAKFVKEQQRQWRVEVEKASKIFIIGLRVVEHDEHIWGVIAQSKAWLGYVGLEACEFKRWAGKVGRKNSYILADTFEKSLPVIERRLYL